MRHTVLRLLLVAVLIWLPLSARAAAKSDQVLVFAASSLTDVLNELAEVYAKTGKPKPVLSFAASSALARQIDSGAPAALFISADEQWMDYLSERKLVAEGTRMSFLGNTLVLITPADQARKVDIKPGFSLSKVLGGGKLSMGDPDSVPVGRYGKAALESLGVWKDVEPSVVRADNVRVALAFVERGEAAAGIVYATDAALTKRVVVAGVFPENSHPPISYSIGIIAANDTPAVRAFRDFLLGAGAKAVFVKYGFTTK